MAKSQKPIYVVITYFSDGYLLSLEPATEVSDYKNLLSYRERLIALLSLGCRVSIKIFTQGPLTKPFCRLWERKSLLYHSPEWQPMQPDYAANKRNKRRINKAPCQQMRHSLGGGIVAPMPHAA
ncbi:MAG: hypothetical protein ACJ74Y_19000 [Bryobacteraceae bacterium]